ncbi:MAG TPA: sigma 54-interacting transcriptional regulator [Kofleriaceae bacterium]|nr:sigma 54-interacting transcriptional regulator [Kofleriaceae bacterium]
MVPLEDSDQHGGFGGQTMTHGPGRLGPAAHSVRGFRVTVVEGPGEGKSWSSEGDRCSIGSFPNNDLVIEDATVSRYHCEIRVDGDGARAVDLQSRNGTYIDGVQVMDGFLRGGSVLRLGRAVIRFQFRSESNQLPISESNRFGLMVGSSVPMRTAFALLERAARSDATVLLEGETGTGKGQAAASIHRTSARADRPFMVVDCGSIPANLLESELFGHEKGAFTGAESRRIGVFEEGDGGTIFLDEIGEMPLELQPKLLRVLENREVRRVGSNTFKPVNVRVIAATNRDLRAEVNAGRFRSDLYFRLAVVRIELPPLRRRPEDIPILVESFLSSPGLEDHTERFRAPEFLGQLQRAAWPGNVRELKNYLERCIVFDEAIPPTVEAGGIDPTSEIRIDGTSGPPQRSARRTEPPGALLEIDLDMPLGEARRMAVEQFERRYLSGLLERHRGRVSQAAAAAGIDRVYMYKLLRRYKLK